jgi:GTP:adenosylcobinamide-phosphate guanylyltransferase
MDAIITAGGTPLPGEPLFEYTQGKPKALVEIAGKPMIQWVLDAITRSDRIDHIVVIGLPELSGVTCIKPTAFIANQKDMLANIRAGIQAIRKINPTAEYALVAASDVPAVTPEMVNWVVDQVEASDADICYNVISRDVMETRYPSSRRTYTHIKDLDLCGGDINAVRLDATKQLSEIWEKLIASRKNPVKQASILGLDVLFGILTKSDPLEKLVSKISHHLKLKGKALVCPFAEIGMDVDKPHQLEMMRADLTSRRTGS